MEFRKPKVRYTHEALIDLIIANPHLLQKEMAAYFGMTEAWVCNAMNSDAFRARLAARKSELVDPIITQGLEERFRGLCGLAVNVAQEKLEANRDMQSALKVMEITAKALGYGASQPTVGIQNNFVVALPKKAESEEAWLAGRTVRGVVEPAAGVVEMQAVEDLKKGDAVELVAKLQDLSEGRKEYTERLVRKAIVSEVQAEMEETRFFPALTREFAK